MTRLITQGAIEVGRDRMTEHLAHQAALQMPQVTSTDAFDLRALDELAKDRLDPIVEAVRIVAARRIWILAGFAKWRKQAGAVCSRGHHRTSTRAPAGIARGMRVMVGGLPTSSRSPDGISP